MRRREFITFIGSAAAAWPFAARGQPNAIINLQTAHSLGIDIPATLLARADEVIE